MNLYIVGVACVLPTRFRTNSIRIGAVERHADFRQHIYLGTVRRVFYFAVVRCDYLSDINENRTNRTNLTNGSVDVGDEVKQIIPILFRRSGVIRHSHTRSFSFASRARAMNKASHFLPIVPFDISNIYT